ncbi:MAG: class I SAM-dependent methyltransferase [Blastocatellia bacterium]|nr:class I SAM-dependent methyltransferase [Blastocatellia bacterium]
MNSRYSEETLRPDAKATQRVYRKRARRYELIHHIGTRFRDTTWRQEVAWLSAIESGARVLDLCTGTGLSAIEYLKVWEVKGIRDLRIVGVDHNNEMLAVGKENLAHLGLADRIELVFGDAMDMKRGQREESYVSFEDSSFDAVLSMCGVGEIEEPTLAFKEMLRVVKPGGRVVVIDVHEPVKGLTSFYTVQRWFWQTIVVPNILRRFWGAGDPSGMIYEIAETTFTDENNRQWAFETLVQVVRTDSWWLSLPINTIGIFCGKKIEQSLHSNRIGV